MQTPHILAHLSGELHGHPESVAITIIAIVIVMSYLSWKKTA